MKNRWKIKQVEIGTNGNWNKWEMEQVKNVTSGC